MIFFISKITKKSLESKNKIFQRIETIQRIFGRKIIRKMLQIRVH